MERDDVSEFNTASDNKPSVPSYTSPDLGQSTHPIHLCMIAHSNSPWAPHYARIFQQRGHRVSLISFHPKPIKGLEMHYVGTAKGDGELPKWLYPVRAISVRRLIRRINPDVVLATYMRSNGFLGSLTKCTPLVVSSRGVDQSFPLPLFGRSISRWICRRADRMHVVSEELRDGLRELGVPEEKITILPVGVDSTLFRPPDQRVPNDVPRILCNRKHLPVYDNATLIAAIDLLNQNGFPFTFTFLGTGPLTAEMKQDVSRRGLEDRVTFIDEVPHTEIVRHLQDSDIYASSSLSDGTSSSLLEAMSCGAFPVVSRIAGNTPWIRHQENGFLFDVGNAEQCAEGVRWAWEHPSERVRAAEENRRTIVEKCDIFKNTIALEELLLSVVR